MTGKKIISGFLDEARAKVIENELWWGDSWSALDYGRPFDFNRSFFSQFRTLREEIPYAARFLFSSENSEYCNNVDGLKDCYFVFNTHVAEHSLYCDYIWWGKSNVDCTRGARAELCYDCVETPGCYNLQSSEFCSDCRDSFFLSQCASCADCFGCVNLVYKRFCIFNTQHTESQYRSILGGIDLSSFTQRENFRKQWHDLKRDAPRPHIIGKQFEESSGNYLLNTNRVHDSLFVLDGEDLKYCFVVNHKVKNCYDYSHFGNNAESLYECQSVGHDAFQLLFCRDCWNGDSDLFYCASCFGCKNCFGCVGLRQREFCILNVQYSRDDYEALVVRIIAQMSRHREWGEFFPMESTPFPYNTSFAARYFPLTKEEALAKGLSWYDREELSAAGALSAAELPDRLPESDTPLTVLSALSGRPFRITAEEIKRYRELKVPLPRLSYQERMEQRWAILGGIRMHERTSAKSGDSIRTSFDEENAPVLWTREEWEGEVR